MKGGADAVNIPYKCVRVLVPATTANLGPGFDALGMALDLNMEVEFEVIRQRGTGEGDVSHTLSISIEGEGSDYLPRDSTNLVYECAKELASHFGMQLPALSIRLVNRIPLSRGMGSSASAIVGGLCAANYILGNVASVDELLSLATRIEGHPDNVAPALLGGIISSSMADSEVLWVRLDAPPDLKLVIAVPTFPLSTHAARGALPGMLLFSDAVFNVSRSSLLVAALSQGRYDLLRYAMEDRLHQPYRKKLVPGMDAVFEAALSSGAHGVALSGAGPSLIALATEDTHAIGAAMLHAWREAGIDCEIIHTQPSSNGVVVQCIGGEGADEE